MPSSLLDDSRYAVRNGLARWSALAPATRFKIGAAVSVVVGFVVALALRSGTPTSEARSSIGAVHARVETTTDIVRPAREIHRGRGAAREEAKAAAKPSAQTYADAARKGDARAFKKLIAMTRAPSCDVRSDAADALSSFHSRKATAALKKLSHAKFRDEARSPGIFSCNSRRAAQKALEKQRAG